jgi:hypothetical protein
LFGAVVGTAVAFDNRSGHNTNTSVYFAGALFKLNANAIYRSIDDGQTFTLVFTLPGGVAALLNGLYVVYNNGIPRLCAVVYGASTNNECHTSLTGLSGSWTTITGVTNVPCGFPVIYRGALAIYSLSNQVVSFNPFAGTSSAVATATGGGTMDYTYLFVWDDVLYAIQPDGSLNLKLTRILGGVATFVLTLDTGGNAKAQAAWIDPTSNNLVIVARLTAGWAAYEVTSALAITSRTATMLTSGALAGFGASSKVVGVFYDQDAAPGAAPAIYLLVSSSNVATTPVSMFKYNGVSALLGTGAGAANDAGGDVQDSWPDKNIGGERFFTARPVGGDGTPSVYNTGKGNLGIGVTRRKFKLIAPRSQVLTTLGGAGTYNLATTPLASIPVQPQFTTIKGVIGAVTEVANDLVTSGVFPVSTLLPAGGTINYLTGAMVGTTALLDAASVVEALYNGGLATNQWYRSLATNEYPGSTTKAPLTLPTSGTIVSDDNINCVADGTEQQISVGMSGFSAGDQVAIDPRAVAQ